MASPLSSDSIRRRPRRRPRRKQSVSPSTTLPATFVAGLLFVCVAVLLFVFVARHSGPDFLFYGNEAAYPVLEYVGGQAAAADGSSTDGTKLEGGGGGAVYDTAFLNSTDDRLLLFYAPWCPHCVKYSPHYVQLARDVTSTEGGSGIKFYAVSCTAHKSMCNENGIRGFPTIKSFGAGNATGDEMSARTKLSSESVLERFSIVAPSRNGTQLLGAKEPNVLEARRMSGRKLKESRSEEPDDAEKVIPRRTKAEVYADASLSFDFALRQSIYMSEGPLSWDARRTFHGWLVLLQKTLPRDMELVHSQIDALLSDFDNVAKAEANLKEVIRDTKPANDKWSESCTHGTSYGGYTCGLWELFHIMTIGVAKQVERLPDEPEERIPAAHAADTLRSYIENFFGCDVCRENFIAMYDECAFDHCTRLTDDPKPDIEEEWRELALWLWEMHNDVNVRLQKERAERDKKPEPTQKEDQTVIWPQSASCPNCWSEDGTWNKEDVYKLLETEYFSEGDSGRHVTRVHMTSGGATSAPLSSYTEIFLVVLFIVPFLLVFWWLLTKREMELSGRHKKSDTDDVSGRQEHRSSTPAPWAASERDDKQPEAASRRQVHRHHSLPV